MVFFDGVCHLCNGFVDWAVRRDRERLLTFAPLQGETAERMLNPDQRQGLSTVLLWDEGRILTKSSAVLGITSRLPGWGWTRALGFVPRVLRDFIYDLIARNRYRLFGRREHCRLPAPEEREILLP